jgi:hypothetical protein
MQGTVQYSTGTEDKVRPQHSPASQGLMRVPTGPITQRTLDTLSAPCTVHVTQCMWVLPYLQGWLLDLG